MDCIPRPLCRASQAGSRCLADGARHFPAAWHCLRPASGLRRAGAGHGKCRSDHSGACPAGADGPAYGRDDRLLAGVCSALAILHPAHIAEYDRGSARCGCGGPGGSTCCRHDGQSAYASGGFAACRAGYCCRSQNSFRLGGRYSHPLDPGGRAQSRQLHLSGAANP